MSELCEHPFCTRSISTKCLNHCQLDLCQEHIIEHKNLFLVQYEKSFNNFNKTLNGLINTIDEKKTIINTNYQKEISLINETYNNKLNELQQKSLFIISTQNLIKKKLQLLTDIKNNQALLYQYDIEQIKLYLKIIHEYHHDKIITETDVNGIEVSSSSSSDSTSDNDYSHELYTNIKAYDINHFRSKCPLTQLGIYGLNDKHNVRLCSSQKYKFNHRLMTHFHHYHHLTWALSYELTKAIMNKSNPLTTYIFQSEINIIDKRFSIIKCPLNHMKLSNCKKKLRQNSLKPHLINIHHLTLKMCNRIVETIKNNGDLMALHFDEDELK